MIDHAPRNDTMRESGGIPNPQFPSLEYSQIDDIVNLTIISAYFFYRSW
jgi:hypothetical protein